MEPFAPTSTSPAPGTSAVTNWGDFIRVVVNGTRDIVTASRTPNFNPYAGYAGTDQPLPAAPTSPAAGSMVGLLVVFAICAFLLKG